MQEFRPTTACKGRSCRSRRGRKRSATSSDVFARRNAWRIGQPAGLRKYQRRL